VNVAHGAPIPKDATLPALVAKVSRLEETIVVDAVLKAFRMFSLLQMGFSQAECMQRVLGVDSSP